MSANSDKGHVAQEDILAILSVILETLRIQDKTLELLLNALSAPEKDEQLLPDTLQSLTTVLKAYDAALSANNQLISAFPDVMSRAISQAFENHVADGY